MDKRRQEALIAEYSEVSSNFRMLTDIRFKLLAFLPIASAAAVAALRVAAPNQESPEGTAGIGLALSLFGLVATIGLVTYNARNDQLYDDLVSRAAAIERNLNIPDGAFANRQKPWLRIPLLLTEWRIDHRIAVGTVYGASIALWLFGVVAYGCWILYELSVFVKNPAAWWVNVIAIVVAIVVTFLGSLWTKYQKKKRSDNMKGLAREAMEKADGLSVAQAVEDPEFILTCAKLSEGSTKDEASDRAQAQVKARAEFYATADPEWLRYYNSQQSQKLSALSASYFIGLLTDLSPLWIYDCGTDRKGEIRADLVKRRTTIVTEPSEAEKREFRRTLREMPSEEISDRRNAEQFGKYDPNDPRNSHWKVIEANRLIDWRRRRQQLVPQWISALIALAALVIAVAELVEALKVP